MPTLPRNLFYEAYLCCKLYFEKLTNEVVIFFQNNLSTFFPTQSITSAVSKTTHSSNSLNPVYLNGFPPFKANRLLNRSNLFRIEIAKKFRKENHFFNFNFLSPFAKYHKRKFVDESEEYFASEGFSSRRSEGRKYPERKLERDSLKSPSSVTNLFSAYGAEYGLLYKVMLDI